MFMTFVNALGVAATENTAASGKTTANGGEFRGLLRQFLA
jgi:hypothetical protein